MFQPRIVHLPSTVLPLFPVFTTQPFYDITIGLTGLTFTVLYTSAEPGVGRPIFRFDWGNELNVPGGGEIGRDVSVEGSSGTALPPNCSFDLCLTEFRGPVPIVGSPTISYLVPACTVPPGQRRVRLQAAEVGSAIAGTMQITLTGFGP